MEEGRAGAAGRGRCWLSKVFTSCLAPRCSVSPNQTTEMSAAGTNSVASTCEDWQWLQEAGLLVVAAWPCPPCTLFRTPVLIVRHREGQEIYLPNYNLTGFLRTFCTSAMGALLCQHCRPWSEGRPPDPFPEHRQLQLLKTCPRAPQGQLEALPYPVAHRDGSKGSL